MRLQRYLARGGVASRRASEELIVAGRVTVNDTIVTLLGTKVFPGDQVCVDGSTVQQPMSERYIALNKPPGFVCTAHDPQKRRRAVELLPAQSRKQERLFSVGRLDYSSSGLLFFTNDGRFAHQVAHPSFGVEKEYLVQTADGATIPEDVLRRYQLGVSIDGETYQLDGYTRCAADEVLLTLRTGKNREIRNVFAAEGLEISRVHRVRIGPVALDKLDSGQHRMLEDNEVAWFLGLERKSPP